MCANQPAASLETAAAERNHGSRLIEQFEERGYFQTQPILCESVLARMNACVRRLHDCDWPAVFAFVYDEFWLVSRTPYLVGVLSTALGPGYKVIPNVWTYYVAPSKSSKGRPPHADGYGLKKRVTVWIPLNDVPVEGSCMYLVPKNLVPNGFSVAGLSGNGMVSIEEFAAVLQAATAMPTRAGSILCWDYDVLHWGSYMHCQNEPRISVSIEFIGENVEPMADEEPLFDAQGMLPTFSQRLRAISKAIRTYHGREPLVYRYVELAQQLNQLALES